MAGLLSAVHSGLITLHSLTLPISFGAVASDAAQRVRAQLELRLPEWKAWAEEHPGRQVDAQEQQQQRRCRAVPCCAVL